MSRLRPGATAPARRFRLGSEMDALEIAVLVELAQPAGRVAVHQQLVVVDARIDEGTLVAQHRHDRAQLLVRRRQDGALVGRARLERVVVAVELRALAAHCAVGTLGQRGPQRGIAVPRASLAPIAGALVVARCQPGPGGHAGRLVEGRQVRPQPDRVRWRCRG